MFRSTFGCPLLNECNHVPCLHCEIVCATWYYRTVPHVLWWQVRMSWRVLSLLARPFWWLDDLVAAYPSLNPGCTTCTAAPPLLPGTFIASLLLKRHPHRVSSVVLVDPVCFGMFLPNLLHSFFYKPLTLTGWGATQ